MIVNNMGELVQKCWSDIPVHFPNVDLDEYIIMPNHFHGILFIIDDDDVEPQHAVSQRHATPPRKFGEMISHSLPTIVRSFKSAVTNHINTYRSTPGHLVWQRNYWERIIRDDDELNRIREYIINNPLKWELDNENPAIGLPDK